MEKKTGGKQNFGVLAKNELLSSGSDKMGDGKLLERKGGGKHRGGGNYLNEGISVRSFG